MPAKDAILDYLGESALAAPRHVASGLAANDRAKLRMTILQLACAGGARTGLDREAEAAGLDPEPLRALLAGAGRTPEGHLTAPGLSALLEGLRGDLETMGGAVEATGGDDQGELTARRLALRPRFTPAGADDIALSAVGEITGLGAASADTVHRLIMDLHKRLNAAAAALSTETLFGAKTIGLAEADHAAIKAFMRGLDLTRGLKFDHPGLDTTAARFGGRLVIQNDIGTTDAHVIVIAVEAKAITVTYTDVHRARARFLIRLLSGAGADWSGLEERHADHLAEGEAFVLVTGRLATAEAEPRAHFLEALGAALVFLIDWNKARKALSRLADKPGAERILLWAARERVGHRAWLQLGGTELIAESVRHAAPTRLGFGARLDAALGRDGTLEFLQAALAIAAEALKEGGSERLVRDRIAAELLRRLERSEAATLELTIRQAGLARDVAAAVLTHLVELRAGRTGGGPELARRTKAIETKADRLAVNGRAAARAAGAGKLLPLVDAIEQTIDELEDAAFCASLLPAQLPSPLYERLAGLCGQAVSAAESLVRAADAAIDWQEGRQVDAADALAALTAVVACEHAADAAEREVFRAVVEEAGPSGPLLAVLELSRGLERATDWAARAGDAIRNNLMADLAA